MIPPKRFLTILWRIFEYLVEKKPFLCLLILYLITGGAFSLGKTSWGERIPHPWILALVIIGFVFAMLSPVYMGDKGRTKK